MNEDSRMNQPVYVSLEFTPNPNTLKYSVNRQLLSRGTVNFRTRDQAKEKSALAEELFGIHGISGVMVGKDFVTVTKEESGDWDVVHKGASEMIEKFLNEGKQPVSEEAVETGKSNLSTDEKTIVDLLEREIRPAVAMDGGDITFDRFEDGVVYLHLQGSCAGCPSSTMTLKMGIETRLKELIPAVKEVVSV